MEINSIQHIQKENLHIYKEKEDLSVSRIKEDNIDIDKKQEDRASLLSKQGQSNISSEVGNTFNSILDIKEISNVADGFNSELKSDNVDTEAVVSVFSQYLEQASFNKDPKLSEAINAFSEEVKSLDFSSNFENKIKDFKGVLTGVENSIIETQKESIQGKYTEPIDYQGTDVFAVGSFALAQANILPSIAKNLLT